VIVIDASAVIDLLVHGPGARAIMARVRRARSLAAPHLLDAEVGQVLRRFERAGVLTLADASAAISDLNTLPITRFPHGPFLSRAFDLRHDATIHDALYVVLAEAIGVPLVTRDTALATIPGHGAKIEVL
jgi:predicted nucleic acid-binding protein